jgi:hypothetical protein
MMWKRVACKEAEARFLAGSVVNQIGHIGNAIRPGPVGK